jgi:hypothetical protein
MTRIDRLRALIAEEQKGRPAPTPEEIEQIDEIVREMEEEMKLRASSQ